MTAVQLDPTKRDYWSSDQDVRWCPGCGDYGILAAMQMLHTELGIERQDTAFISGIGCAARFPYYMNTYGMHTIHGRSPAIATGLAMARPDLNIWVVGGDGDMLSIGGNHLIHALRRNVNLTILLFNNQIYGLTKGQFSPTSEVGKVTKSTPMGSIDPPFNPVSLALGAGATFVARTHDLDRKHMMKVFRRAHAHRGSSLVEIYQNCNVFNDGAYSGILKRDQRADKMIELEHGQPIVFGAEKQRSVVLDGPRAELVDNADPTNIEIHDEAAEDPSAAFALSRLTGERSPTPFGVFRAVDRAEYTDSVDAQLAEARAKSGEGNLTDLLNSGSTWTVD